METEREKMEGYCVWRLGSLRRMREREGRLVGSSDSEMAQVTSRTRVYEGEVADDAERRCRVIRR
jgi:hypothetical protein